MAPLAFILGGICGTFSALFSWLLFGLTFGAAVQVYFVVGLTVAALMILAALKGPRATTKSSAAVKSGQMQQA
ncbi:MAG: hypothetical protein AB8B82_04620 [Roseovarius sp.]